MTAERPLVENQDKKPSNYKRVSAILIGIGIGTGKIALVATGLAILEFGFVVQGSIIEKVKKRFREDSVPK